MTNHVTPPSENERVLDMPFAPHPTVRVGIVGVGGRGNTLLRDLIALDDVQVIAVCDSLPEKCERAAAKVTDAGQPRPALYSGSDDSYEALCRRDDIDLVYVATTWETHTPVAVCAMENGKHAAVEVPAATTVEDCWRLVDTSERTRRHCVMLENCCYGYNELLVLKLVRAGRLGELTHGAAAYNHDLRHVLFSDGGEGLWRRTEHIRRNGNLYPTHGLGPVAAYMDINRGDRFETLVSMSSLSVGLDAYRKQRIPPEDPRWQETYRCGDQNTSLIRTARGRLITLEHNVSIGQPYDRINLIAGTGGIFRDYPARLYLDGQPEGETFTSLDPYAEEFGHRLWREIGELARKQGGHGGMDFLMSFRLIECMRQGTPPDMDVYDAAAWSVPGPLSEMSVEQGSAPVPVPDFTRGNWEASRPGIA